MLNDNPKPTIYDLYKALIKFDKAVFAMKITVFYLTLLSKAQLSL